MVFGGSIMLVTPLLTLLMLRELGLAPRRYRLSLGLPCLGGLIGSLCAPRRAAAVVVASSVLLPWRHIERSGVGC